MWQPSAGRESFSMAHRGGPGENWYPPALNCHAVHRPQSARIFAPKSCCRGNRYKLPEKNCKGHRGTPKTGKGNQAVGGSPRQSEAVQGSPSCCYKGIVSCCFLLFKRSNAFKHIYIYNYIIYIYIYTVYIYIYVYMYILCIGSLQETLRSAYFW